MYEVFCCGSSSFQCFILCCLRFIRRLKYALKFGISKMLHFRDAEFQSLFQLLVVMGHAHWECCNTVLYMCLHLWLLVSASFSFPLYLICKRACYGIYITSIYPSWLQQSYHAWSIKNVTLNNVRFGMSQNMMDELFL